MSEIDPGQLQQIERRLREIWHKHVRIIISDDQDVVEVKQRLEGILNTLSDWTHTPPAHDEIRAVARDLGTAQRQLSILGFVNIARVMSRVEEALADLGTARNGATEPAPPQRFVQPASTSAARPVGDATAEVPFDDVPKRPSLLFFALHIVGGAAIGWVAGQWLINHLAFAPTSLRLAISGGVALGVVCALLHRMRPQTTGLAIVRFLTLVTWSLASIAALAMAVHSTLQSPVEIVETAPVSTVPPTAAVQPTATPSVETSGEVAMENITSQVSNEIKLTEAALERSDLNAAIDHFGKAVAIDRYHRLIKDTAAKLIEEMLDEADRAADRGQWDRAGRLVNDALDLAEYFYLDTTMIKLTQNRHNSTARFVDTAPTDVAKLRASIGKRVKVMLVESSTIRGTIHDVTPTELTLDVLSGVGGGQVSFTKVYPLTEMTNVRVYGEGMIDPPKDLPTPTAVPKPARRRSVPQRPRRTSPRRPD